MRIAWRASALAALTVLPLLLAACNPGGGSSLSPAEVRARGATAGPAHHRDDE